MKHEIQKFLEKAIKTLGYDIKEVDVDYPKNEVFGDYTTNVAMVLSKSVKKNPMTVAEEIVAVIASEVKQSQNSKIKLKKNEIATSPSAPRNDENIFEKIEIAKPGYINFYLSKEYLQNKIGEINKQKNKFGESKNGKGIKVNNEFISANPTGPLHLGNGRGGFLGDVIGKILEKSGYDNVNEYYVNDAGEQVLKLGHSVAKDSEAVYAGDYIDELNKKFKGAEDIKKIGEKSGKIILDKIIKKTVKEKMQINFDSWISEKKDLYDSGYVEKAIEKLKKKKLTYEKDGALWLETTKFGDDKDRVLVKKDGQKTYFASDCGYILNKIERKFEKIIEIWGADHHGYISRFKAATEALGFKGELKFVIVQLVRLVKDGKEARMSKRAGNIVYIDELISEVGLDAVRFFFLMYDANTHMTFDLNLAKERSEKNPVYYIQYAYARIANILAKSQKLKVKSQKSGNLSLLTHEKELNLIRELNKFPELIESISKNYEVHRLPYYAINLADKFHSFYNDCKVIDEENPELTSARLNLINAVKIVLGETLRILGVNAPDKM
ncbi:MAG TPA: arginine--tRNA ligase [Candidatus Moranbacteria bacterium]|nr:arginine--tRNA ligase [Candidatus Moranbacteria bacterium]